MNASASRHRYLVDFSVDGDIRFLAHNDMLRMFSRACARAGLPVCYSSGFSPRIRLSLPLPKPVGQSSDAERLLVDLTDPVDGSDLLQCLQSQMPAGVRLTRATTLEPSDTCRPEWVRYRIDCPEADPDQLASRVKSLLTADSIVVTRVRHKDGRSKAIDIRPFVDAVRVCPGAVEVSLVIDAGGTATPAEVCGVLGMDADAINHRIRRMEVRWQESQPTQTTTP